MVKQRDKHKSLKYFEKRKKKFKESKDDEKKSMNLFSFQHFEIKMLMKCVMILNKKKKK